MEPTRSKSNSDRPKHALSGPRSILILLAVGWGPIFVADSIREMSSALDKSYKPQGFIMGWGLTITALSTLLAVVLCLVNIVRFFAHLASSDETGARK
jgi:hypothetical protein